MKYVVDTNYIIDYPKVVLEHDSVILSHVLREFESLELKFKLDKALMASIREAKRILETEDAKVTYDIKDYHVTFDKDLDSDYTDNKIIQCCLDNGYGIITNDKLLKIKAKMYGIDIITNEFKDDSESYTGVHELFLNPVDGNDATIILDLMETPQFNPFNLVQNEYLVLWDKTKPTYNDDGDLVGYEHIKSYRFDGHSFVKINYRKINNGLDNSVEPINIKQKLAFDMMQNKEVTVKAIFGGFGVGKDYIMIAHALKLLREGSIEKIVWVRNNVETKDTNPIGFLPDGMKDKLLPFMMPLADHVGGIDELTKMIAEGTIEVQHLGFIRGRDIKNSIIYVTECENNTREHMQLLMGRVGVGSQLWLNGDTQQVDDRRFEVNSGLNALKELKGEPLYGQVTLDKVERSETARLADKLNR